MLTETEVHYLVGYLYLHTKRTGIAVTATAILGDKVLDVAAEKGRDVDIVIAAVGTTALIAVEVKNEHRPLDVITVEQVAAKLNDMPALAEKFLVSTSGFTGPAAKKARAHGLQCLHLRRGVVPVVATIDLTGLAEITWTTTDCLDDPAPHVQFQPCTPVSADVAAEFQRASIATLRDGTTIEMKELMSRMIRTAVASLNGLGPNGDYPFQVQVMVDDLPTIKLSAGELTITHGMVSGVVRRTTRSVPWKERCVLEDEDGVPFALALVAVVGGTLFGLMLNDSRNMGFFMLPESLRAVRPIRHTI